MVQMTRVNIEMAKDRIKSVIAHLAKKDTNTLAIYELRKALELFP